MISLALWSFIVSRHSKNCVTRSSHTVGSSLAKHWNSILMDGPIFECWLSSHVWSSRNAEPWSLGLFECWLSGVYGQAAMQILDHLDFSLSDDDCPLGFWTSCPEFHSRYVPFLMSLIGSLENWLPSVASHFEFLHINFQLLNAIFVCSHALIPG